MKVKFTCVKCGLNSWFQIAEDYIVSIKDLICDDCVESLVDDIENDEVPIPEVIFHKEA